MKNSLITLLGILIFYSCSNIVDENSTINNETEQIFKNDSSEFKSEISQINKKQKDTLTIKESECGCFNGIGSIKGDDPVKTYIFENGISVSICGYYESEKQNEGLNISEFDIFNCKTGKSYVRYGAVDNCLIEISNDSLIINLLDFLPNNEKWEWNSVIQAQQVITSSGDSLITSPLKACYKKTGYNQSIAQNYLSSLEKGKGFDENWEHTIGRLKFLSLEGNQQAWKILQNYDKFTGFTPDGAMAEDWKDAISMVQWITDLN